MALKAVVGALAACVAVVWGREFTQDQLQARFYYDLGPSQVDVSSYPKQQQDNYLVFRRTCSQCHTLARPINSSIVERKDWKRYIQRMHLHTQTRAGTSIPKENARAVLDFLAYDAQVRKVKDKAAFEAKTQELKSLFQEVQKERVKLEAAEDQKKTRPAPPYTGIK